MNARKETMNTIKVKIPSPLRTFTNGADTIEAAGANVGEVLNNLKAKAAGIETRLFKTPGQLNRFVNVYLNDEDIRHLKNLETEIKAGDEISIIPAIAGGTD
jgi:sulfur-carrier protein